MFLPLPFAGSVLQSVTGCANALLTALLPFAWSILRLRFERFALKALARVQTRLADSSGALAPLRW